MASIHTFIILQHVCKFVIVEASSITWVNELFRFQSIKNPIQCKHERDEGLFLLRPSPLFWTLSQEHYNDVIMTMMASQITSITIVYSTVYSGADQRKHQSSSSLAFVRGIHRWPVDSPHKWPVTRKMFPFDDVIMNVRHRAILFLFSPGLES